MIDERIHFKIALKRESNNGYKEHVSNKFTNSIIFNHNHKICII